MNEYMLDVIKDLEGLDKLELFEYIIDLGKDLPKFEDDIKVSSNMVHGCVSSVYVDTVIENNKIYFKGVSDSLISKGYILILINAFNGIKKEEFCKNSEKEVKEFLMKTKINESSIPSRANAFYSIYELMRKKVCYE